MPEPAFTTIVATSLRRLARVIRCLQPPRQRWQRLEDLHEADLRDLGLDRSELSSCAAEAQGTATSTRRRIGLLEPR